LLFGTFLAILYVQDSKKGKTMPSQMIIRIDSDTKIKLTRLAKSEGKSNSQIIRELIQNYISERDIGAYIDDLWGRTGQKLKDRDVKEADINAAIRDVREANQ